jgi:hypothetical protein
MQEQSFPNSPGRRAAAYWFIDGLPEIVAGVGFVAFGGGAVWFGQAHPHSWSVRAVFLALALISLLVVFAFDRPINLFLKSRVTFPRTGYVRPPADLDQVSQREVVISLGLVGDERPPDQNVTNFRTSTISVVILGNILAGAIAKPVGLPIALTLVAVVLYALHRHSERPYHWASVLLLPATGMGAMFLNMEQRTNDWLAVLIGGAWLCGQGAWRLLGYLHRYPKGEPAESLRP